MKRLLALLTIIFFPVLLTAQSYNGDGANWVQVLLSRAAGPWSCPSTVGGMVYAVRPTAAQNPCLRDTYVNAAVQAAWGAECESRFSRTAQASQDASSMLSSLKAAASLCSNSPTLGTVSCPTERIVSCDELASFGAPAQSTLEQQALQQLDSNQGVNQGGGDLESQAVSSMEQSSTDAAAQAAAMKDRYNQQQAALLAQQQAAAAALLAQQELAKQRALAQQQAQASNSDDDTDTDDNSNAQDSAPSDASNGGNNLATFVQALGQSLSQAQQESQQQYSNFANSLQQRQQKNTRSAPSTNGGSVNCGISTTC